VPTDHVTGGTDGGEGGRLDKQLCQVGGVNLNYVSPSGTLYHVQVEDRGPVLDAVAEESVRRINVIVYANYGEPNARIIHGADHDFADLRTHEHNRLMAAKVRELADAARRIVDEKEQRQVMRIKCLIREYYYTKADAAKREFEHANALFPILFSRAWGELKQEQVRSGSKAMPAPEPTAPPAEVVYPLDPELRERVLEIERVVRELGRDLDALRARGLADDILLQTCRKLVARAEDSICKPTPSDYTVRRLEMMRNSLTTTWRQVRSRIR
jgi:hypothetical protein